MRISKVRIRRYRAFDRQVDAPLEHLTVLTGPNNLGKSTVLNALNVFFSELRGATRFGMDRSANYDYDIDYPKKYSGKAGRRWPTQIGLQLQLTPDDRNAIVAGGADTIPGQIEPTLEYKYDSRADRFRGRFDIPSVTDEQKRLIVDWLAENARYVHIPATRNINDFRRNIFRQLTPGAIQNVSRSRQRVQAIRRLYTDVVEEFSNLAEDLTGELQKYLPSVSSMNFQIDEFELEDLISLSDIVIDDGAPTALDQKGDGFKSLFTISVLQYIARQQYSGQLIFGIEEPESHLHSSAVYKIKSTLRDLAKSYQVIVTTHSPILIERDKISANIVVEQEGGGAFASTIKPAKNLGDIRRSLGIQPSENMTSAEVVVVVEGATEERTLMRLVARVQPDLAAPLTNGRIRALSANSASHVPTLVRALARDAASCIVLLDADEQGLRVAEELRQSGLIDVADVFTVATRDGCLETEYEDQFEPAIYLPRVCEAAGIAVTDVQFQQFRVGSGNQRTRMAKWSRVMERIVAMQGQNWDAVADNAKTAFADALIEATEGLPTASLSWLRGLSAQIRRHLD